MFSKLPFRFCIDRKFHPRSLVRETYGTFKQLYGYKPRGFGGKSERKLASPPSANPKMSKRIIESDIDDMLDVCKDHEFVMVNDKLDAPMIGESKNRNLNTSRTGSPTIRWFWFHIDKDDITTTFELK